MSYRLTLPLACLLALAGCKREAEAPAPAAPAAPPVAAHSFSPAITAADFAEHVKTLASDEFEGRAPGTVGEDKTVEYLRTQFERMGYQPGAPDGSWFQTVPMQVSTADPATTLTLEVGGKTRTLAFGTDMVVGTRTGQPEVKLEGSEMVFVGYGVDAPEQKWNDYAGLDVKGKTVVILVNDPGFHAGDESLFEGRRMTYYGRWTYKFEEAARKGAAAALIVHDDAGASYGWDVVRNSWSGEQFDLRAADDPEPRLPIQGWITGEAARRLFADAGLDFEALRAAANKRGFKPVPLKAKASVTLKSTVAEKSSRNVIARLPGRERPDEAVVYMAHWDHLGKHEGEGDTIYNGAVDNATGVAGILEIAEAFATQEPRPKRTLLFVAVTLEESGLLGSKYYVAHPSVPMDKTVAVINLDAMPVYGKSRDMIVIGLGNSELEDILKEVAAKQGRTLRAETAVEAGYYFRSDHFNLAKAGVPALYAKGGEDLLEGGAEAGRKAAEDYTANRYHKPADEFDPNWKLDGVVQDLEALYAVGRQLADSDRWPNWYQGNPFRAAREASRKAATAP
ncbi:M28 family metallopeptidase [Vulcaniibacterium gelatinicum]|uniref:M28 family metallopeptidase n=1 Tax=Vulcaniibacterium gelatinicum TaxID=2598725 RepID=UPI0011C9E0A9|nr:M28 family metallopeptidase [Vulcaniibacterium gelatinicum]